MYHLLTGLYEHLTRKDEYSVVIIGLDNVGHLGLLLIVLVYADNRVSPNDTTL